MASVHIPGTEPASLPTASKTHSSAALQKCLETGQLSWTGPLLMLGIRLILFGLFQVMITGIFTLQGSAQAWQDSVGWWPIAALLTNIICLILLDQLMKLEGLHLRDLYWFDRTTIRQDSLAVLGLLLLIAPLVMLPSYALGIVIFGDANITFEMMFLPLPLWARWLALTLFPLTIALAELPTYFAYVMPRIAVLSNRTWLAVLLPVLLLSFQHATLPLIFDWRFITWRLFMFLGFALVVGLGLNWRPRLLPYLMVIHGLLDFATGWLVFSL